MKKPRKPTVAFLTHDWSWGTDPLQPNGCAWYRCKLPADELNRYGWFAAVGFPGFSSQRGFGMLVEGQKAVHGWDIIVFKLLMQQEVLDSLPIAKKMGQKIVVDVDDWFDGLSESNMAFKTTSAETNPRSNREIYKKIILSADAVITSTPFLFDYYAKLRDNVFLVRNGIDVQRWRKKQINANKKIRVGWVGATHWRSNDLEQLSDFFGQYIELRNLYFQHSGHVHDAPSAASLLRINMKNTRTIPMAPILSYPQLFKEIDIGIVPLNDVPFNYAKSFIKGLEYAASGIPFISSYSPEYQYLADNGIGRIARTPNEWIYHMDELLDVSMRKDEADVNYDLLKNFSMEVRGKDWHETFTYILEKL